MKRSAREVAALEHYRAFASPDSRARERMLQGLNRRFAHGELPQVIASGPPARLVQAATLPVSRALLMAAALATAVAVMIAVWSKRSSDKPVASRQASSAQAEIAAARQAPAPVQPSQSSEVVAPVRDEQSPAPPRKALPGRPPKHHALRESAVPPPSAAAKDKLAPAAARELAAPAADGQQQARRRDLDEELKLLRGAYDALNAGNTDAAFKQLAEHAARFPRGELSESREVTRMIALCQVGQSATARAQAAQFLARSPDSPYAARVRLICRDASGESAR
jgi:hypothetical protein